MTEIKDKDGGVPSEEQDEFGGFDANFGSGEDEIQEETAVTPPDGKETSEGQDEEFDLESSDSKDDGAGAEPENIGGKKKSGGEPSVPTKQARKPLTKRQKIVRVMLRRAGLDTLPDLSVIMRHKEGEMVAIRDIALFIGTPKDEVLAEIAADIPIKNLVNLSAEVEKNRVVTNGVEILRAGRMFQPIQLANIVDENGKSTDNLQCTSGRHRLAFLALVYGPSASIPVYIEDMTLNEARDAVVVANQSRPTRALERAEHAVLGSVCGNADAQQAAIYEATATTKTKANKYCVYSVFEKGHPLKLKFPVSATSSRKDGTVTTVSNVENFWSAALAWEKEMPWKKFDDSLKASVRFLNGLVEAMQSEPGFDANHHLASMTLSAIGKWYRAYREITGVDMMTVVSKVAKTIVSFGQIGRQKSETTYTALTEAMRV